MLRYSAPPLLAMGVCCVRELVSRSIVLFTMPGGSGTTPTPWEFPLRHLAGEKQHNLRYIPSTRTLMMARYVRRARLVWIRPFPIRKAFIWTAQASRTIGNPRPHSEREALRAPKMSAKKCIPSDASPTGKGEKREGRAGAARYGPACCGTAWEMRAQRHNREARFCA